MAKQKQYAVGEVSFTESGWKDFVSLDYDAQLKQIANSLSPKSEVRAAKLLKGVPNGDISSRVATEGEDDNSALTSGRYSKSNTEKSKTATSKD